MCRLFFSCRTAFVAQQWTSRIIGIKHACTHHALDVAGPGLPKPSSRRKTLTQSLRGYAPIVVHRLDIKSCSTPACKRRIALPDFSARMMKHTTLIRDALFFLACDPISYSRFASLLLFDFLGCIFCFEVRVCVAVRGRIAVYRHARGF